MIFSTVTSIFFHKPVAPVFLDLCSALQLFTVNIIRTVNFLSHPTMYVMTDGALLSCSNPTMTLLAHPHGFTITNTASATPHLQVHVLCADSHMRLKPNLILSNFSFVHISRLRTWMGNHKYALRSPPLCCDKDDPRKRTGWLSPKITYYPFNYPSKAGPS